MPSLRRLRRADGPDGRASAYLWGGRELRVRDDAATALSALRMLAEPMVSPGAKRDILARMLLPGLGASWPSLPDAGALPAALAWECCRADLDGSHAAECSGERVVDWEADGPYLRATSLAAWGMTYDELCAKVTFSELCELVGLAPRDTPMGQAVYYRTAEPPGARAGAQARAEFSRRREFWSLKGERDRAGRMETANRAAADAFASLKRRALDGS